MTAPYREMPPGPPPPKRMRRWHHHLGIFLAVAVADCGLPDHWFREHPVKTLILMLALTIDYRTGYWRGRLEEKCLSK